MSKSDFFIDSYAVSTSHIEEEKEYTISDIVAIIDEAINGIAVMLDNKEYDKALPKLLEIYDLVVDRTILSKLDDEYGTEQYLSRFEWLCFRISYCYCEQQDYIRAFFYIDQVSNTDSNCFIEWINVIVNGGMLGALGIVEAYINDPSQLKDICKDDEDLEKVMSFLERRLGYLYIELGEYEEARKLFTRLLSNPASSDFAREELEYLDGLEKKE